LRTLFSAPLFIGTLLAGVLVLDALVAFSTGTSLGTHVAVGSNLVFAFPRVTGRLPEGTELARAGPFDERLEEERRSQLQR